jgi:hypothetical protein
MVAQDIFAMDSEMSKLFCEVTAIVSAAIDTSIYLQLNDGEYVDFTFSLEDADGMEIVFFEEEDLQNLATVLLSESPVLDSDGQGYGSDEDLPESGANYQLSFGCHSLEGLELITSKAALDKWKKKCEKIKPKSGFEERALELISWGLWYIEMTTHCKHVFADLEEENQACTKCGFEVYLPGPFSELYSNRP